jgi:C-terminal processing protease CtpA/Prc
MNTVKAFIMVLFFLNIAFVAWAGPPPGTLDEQTKSAVIDEVVKKLNEIYVFPEVAKKMEKHLKKQFKKGAYKAITEPAEFARVLTKDLRDICHDLHLRVRYYPEPPQRRPEEPPDPAEIKRRLGFVNYAFDKAERLPGNIGYLKFDGFMGAQYAGATAVAALNFLAHCDALIIDLRQNGGGAPSMIQLITSYFFDEPKHLNSFYIRKTDETKQFWTQSHVQGPRLTDTDLYVLTSSRTFSAAEEFTYNLKNMERATIVGETTGGGAHPVQSHYFEGLQFGIVVPYGRAINPISGTNWEGKGIEPHVKVPQAEALDKAYHLALEKLVKETEDKEKKRAIERDINLKGYTLLIQEQVKEAIETFKLNVELFPQSFNAYDSLAEAYMKDKQNELAVKNYQKSLELNPDNRNAVKMLKKLQEDTEQ